MVSWSTDSHVALVGIHFYDEKGDWYCGDNGIPASGRATTPFRGQKGQVYEGGIRVPGIIEWPERIPEPRVTDVNAVTSDMLPTVCDVVGQPLPDRPLDGISLKALIDGEMTERPRRHLGPPYYFKLM